MNEKLNMAVQEAKNILTSLDIEFGPVTSVFVTKSKSSWGQCNYNRATGNYTIGISYMLLRDEVSHDALMDTVIHEFLHAHKDRMCHTGEWKKCANLVNYKYGYHIKRATSVEEKGLSETDFGHRVESYKYIITCNSCGNKNYYKRKSKVVSLIMSNPKGSCRCGVCGSSDFKIEY